MLIRQDSRDGQTDEGERNSSFIPKPCVFPEKLMMTPLVLTGGFPLDRTIRGLYKGRQNLRLSSLSKASLEGEQSPRTNNPKTKKTPKKPTMIVELTLLLTVFLIALAQFVRFRRRVRLWATMGVAHPKDTPNYLMGNSPTTHPDFLMGRRSHTYIMHDQCKEFEQERFYGTYGPFGIPCLIVKDLDLVQDVLVRDFDHFYDHIDKDSPMNPFVNTGNSRTDKIWASMLPFILGAEWKAARNVFSPVFTSGKMKLMLRFMKGLSWEMESELAKVERTGLNLDIRELFGRFSMDNIASCAFGVDSGALRTPLKADQEKNPFVRNASKVAAKES